MSDNCSNSLGAVWPNDLYIICGAGQLILPGDVSSIFATMKKWKIRVFKNGTPLTYQDPGNGDEFFDYTAITGEATWSVSASDGDRFIIQAYKPAS